MRVCCKIGNVITLRNWEEGVKSVCVVLFENMSWKSRVSRLRKNAAKLRKGDWRWERYHSKDTVCRINGKRT